MKKFRMRPKKKIIGEDLYPTDIIIVEANHPSNINTQMVRDALKLMCNKQMRCVYNYPDWVIEEIK